jgi:DNA-binding MarR family transcriptional regulator
MVKKPQINTKAALKLGLTLQQTYFLWLIYTEKNQILECDRIYLSEKLMCSVSQISKLTRLLEEFGFILREKPNLNECRYHLREKAQQLFKGEKNAKATKKISKEICSEKKG